jgi:hypothetical protein
MALSDEQNDARRAARQGGGRQNISPAAGIPAVTRTPRGIYKTLDYENDVIANQKQVITSGL